MQHDPEQEMEDLLEAASFWTTFPENREMLIWYLRTGAPFEEGQPDCVLHCDCVFDESTTRVHITDDIAVHNCQMFPGDDICEGFRHIALDGRWMTLRPPDTFKLREFARLRDHDLYSFAEILKPEHMDALSSVEEPRLPNLCSAWRDFEERTFRQQKFDEREASWRKREAALLARVRPSPTGG